MSDSVIVKKRGLNSIQRRFADLLTGKSGKTAPADVAAANATAQTTTASPATPLAWQGATGASRPARVQAGVRNPAPVTTVATPPTPPTGSPPPATTVSPSPTPPIDASAGQPTPPIASPPPTTPPISSDPTPPVSADATPPTPSTATAPMTGATPPVTPSPDPQKAQYEQRRTGLKLDEDAVLRIGDIPPELKALRDTFIASAAATKAFADAGDWAGAVTSLTKFETDLKTALKARRKNMADATKVAVLDIKAKLYAPSGGGVAWSDVGSDKWKVAVDAICAVQLDPDFTARYDEMNKKVAADIAADPTVKEAYAKWNEWTSNPAALTTNAAKIEAFMNKVLELQSKVVGIDPPTQSEAFSDTSPGAECGSFHPGSKRLKINVGIRAFKDFRELLDTLTHENTHAFQTKIIEAYKAGTLPEDDPNYNAAIALAMNENAGYVSSDESDQYPGKDAYMTQCCEAHAWRAGGNAGKTAYRALREGARTPPSGSTGTP